MPISPSTQQPAINISHSELVSDDIIKQYYSDETLQKVLATTLDYIVKQHKSKRPDLDIVFPYFEDLDFDVWQSKPKELDIYITDLAEAKQLNNEARGKDYATNILSYPSELPPFILEEMPTIPLGELVVCNEVVVTQAKEQNKTIEAHAIHLLVHGILHLLGFDHELGDAEADEMEGFEIEVMKLLGFENPYEQ